MRIPPPPDASIDRPAVSADGRSVGWLVLPPVVGDDGREIERLPQRIDVRRDGHATTVVDTDAIVWSWRFVAKGRAVASCVGPVHGGASSCAERDVRSHATLARWHPRDGRTVPAWMVGLDH